MMYSLRLKCAMVNGETEKSFGTHLSLEQIRTLRALCKGLREDELNAEDAQQALDDTLEIIRLPEKEKPRVDGPSLRVAAGKHASGNRR